MTKKTTKKRPPPLSSVQEVDAAKCEGRSRTCECGHNVGKHDKKMGCSECGCERTDRLGRQCRQPKGHGTDHPGEGKCRYHGGMTPIHHGRYSSVKSKNRVLQLYEVHMQDPNPLDAVPELAMARAVLQFSVEEFDNLIKMLTVWHEHDVGKYRAELNELQRVFAARDSKKLAASIGRLRDISRQMPPKPHKVPDILEVTKAIRVIGDLTDKITQMRERHAIPLSSVIDMQTKMAFVMMQELRGALSDRKVKTVGRRIADAWKNIQIET